MADNKFQVDVDQLSALEIRELFEHVDLVPHQNCNDCPMCSKEHFEIWSDQFNHPETYFFEEWSFKCNLLLDLGLDLLLDFGC